MRLSELFEAFDFAPDLKWDGGLANQVSHGAFDTSFVVSGEKYLVSISQDAEPGVFKPEVWSVSFRQDSSPGYTPNGYVGHDAQAVLGGVVTSVKTFIADHHPLAIGLTGKHRDRLGRLYAIMAKHLAHQISRLGYRIENRTVDDISGPMEVILLYREGDPADYLD